MASDREQVHGMLEAMLEPRSSPLDTIPLEDEEISAGEERAVASALEWRKSNEPIPMEEVLADFGLTMADFERMGQTARSPSREKSFFKTEEVSADRRSGSACVA